MTSCYASSDLIILYAVSTSKSFIFAYHKFQKLRNAALRAMSKSKKYMKKKRHLVKKGQVKYEIYCNRRHDQYCVW
jgi:hypothetical protein